MFKKYCVTMMLISCNINADRVETLIGVEIVNSGITYQVKSGGCTTKRSFIIKLLKSSPVGVQLIRTIDDNCEALLEFGTKLRFSYEELGLKPGQDYMIINPLLERYWVPINPIPGPDTKAKD